jgi:hypothetical protein
LGYAHLELAQFNFSEGNILFVCSVKHALQV